LLKLVWHSVANHPLERLNVEADPRREGPHVFTYSAICDVPEEAPPHLTALLRGHRREIGTRKGRRAGSERTQAKLVLRWFRNDAPIRLLAAGAGLEAIDVIAEQAPDVMKERGLLA
jgi:hypothetical protein